MLPDAACPKEQLVTDTTTPGGVLPDVERRLIGNR
jgi:hypothetical protein